MGAGVLAGTVVVVVGAIDVVVDAIVVVGIVDVELVITAVVDVVEIGIHTAPGVEEVGATDATTGTGGVYPHPDNTVGWEIFIVARIFLPLFKRNWFPAVRTFEEQMFAAPVLSVFVEATFDHFMVFFTFTPISTTTGLDFHFEPAVTAT